MNKQQRKQAFATNALLEHNTTDPQTNAPRPSPEAIQQAKEWVDENQL